MFLEFESHWHTNIRGEAYDGIFKTVALWSDIGLDKMCLRGGTTKYYIGVRGSGSYQVKKAEYERIRALALNMTPSMPEVVREPVESNMDGLEV